MKNIRTILIFAIVAAIPSLLVVSYAFPASAEENQPQIKPKKRTEHDTYKIQRHDREFESRSHTTWYGDSMWVQIDTVFVKYK